MSSRASCILLPELQPAVFRIIRPDEKVNGVIKFESEPGFGIIRPKLPYKDPNRTKFALRKTLEIVGLNGQHLIINSHAPTSPGWCRHRPALHAGCAAFCPILY